MGPLKSVGLTNEPFKNDLILAKSIFFLIHLAKIKSFLNGSLDRPAVLSGPMAFDPIYSRKYCHIFIYFIHQVITDFSKYAAQAIATLPSPTSIVVFVPAPPSSSWNTTNDLNKGVMS